MTTVTLEVVGGIGKLTLQRPEKRNAINGEMFDEATTAINSLQGQGVSVALLAATGEVFCAGADLNEVGSGSSTRLVEAIAKSNIFWVAALQGPALGAGVALACVCPIVVAAEEAWLRLPEVELGIFPSGPLRFLDALMLPRDALRLALGERMTATAAQRIGLVSEVVEHSLVWARAMEWARRLRDTNQATSGGLAMWHNALEVGPGEQ